MELIGHNSEVDHSQLRAFVERIERLESEIKELNDDKAEVYSEAKGNGFDTKILKRVVALQRTKSIRLLHKQITKDSTISGQGLADYILSFRKPGDNPEPVAGMFDEFHGSGLDISRAAYDRHAAQTRAEGREPWPFDMWVSVLVWQRYASPVWMDIDQTNTLQYRSARDEKDEQHISPLQLDVIERCIDLWSNPGDVVITPFLGIGSEVYSAVKMGRRGVGFELKPSYFRQAVRNIAALQDHRNSGADLLEFAKPA